MKQNKNGYILWETPVIAVIATNFVRKSKNGKTGKMIQITIFNRWINPVAAIASGADKNVCFNCAMRPSLPVTKPKPDWQEAEALDWRTFSVGNPVANHFVCPASKERGHKTDCAHCGACAGNTQRQRRSVTIKPHGSRARKRKCYVPMRWVLAMWKCYRDGGYAKLDSFERFRDRAVRFGAYGEPVKIPLDIVKQIVAVAKTHTGYTHQWRRAEFAGYRDYFMASTNS